MFQVSVSHNAVAAIKSLPREAQIECKSLVEDLKTAGNRLGKPLEEKHGMDLRGCYKVYFSNREYRIVYTMLSANEVYILAVGKRENLQAYVEAYNIRQHIPKS